MFFKIDNESSVGIAARPFSTVETSSATHPTSGPMGIGGRFPEVELPEREDDSPPFGDNCIFHLFIKKPAVVGEEGL